MAIGGDPLPSFGKSFLVDFPGDNGCAGSVSHHSRGPEVGVSRLDESFGETTESLLDPVPGERLPAGDLLCRPDGVNEEKKPRGIVSGVPGDIGGVLIRLAS